MKDAAESSVKPSLRADGIPNINIGQSYDQHYTDAEIHYENLENLAAFLAAICRFITTTGFTSYT